ncbi:receptor-type tyrosine-protein phosphatase eta-like [Erpetoichthys calabaricus]|uniref:receptor-type tyrosine-protein phosphatase eta-like n=1 Tax=Erpetoichthys calabaricus TaxID=27687 RepID=UPI002234019F|nr:receptor-type tyrosine-protein phosphatase eta-like [Erpetoichthys calabaricus]
MTERDAVAVMAVIKPGVVYNLTISNISSSSLFLSWTPPNGNVGRYTVEVSGSTVMNVTTTSAFANLTGLIPDSIYTLQVVALAVDNMTEGDAVAITGITKPGVVYNLTISNISTSSLFLSWTPPNGNVGSYRVDVSGSTVMNVTTTSAFANLTGLIPGSMYTLQVVALAVDNMTEGDAVAITGITKPGVVYNLTISNISTSSLFLSWTPPNGNVGSYRVDVSGSTVMNVTTTSAFANLTGLIPGSMYTLQVVALAVDNMTEGDAVAITGITKPGVVYNLTISNISTSSLFLSWTPPNGNVGSYRVDVSGSTVMNVTTTSAFANLTGLIPGSMYTLQVVALAVDNMTEGDAVAITGITKPGVVYNLTISNISTSSLFLSWTPPNGNVGSYRVDVSGSTVMNVTTTSAFANLTGLIPGSMYTLQVVALAVDNMTEGDAVAITGITKPGVVYNLTISNISTSSLFLSWTPPNGNVGSYRVDVSGSTVMNVTTTSAFANLTGLIPGSMYTLQVVALAVDNMTEGDAVAITGITKPGVVYNLTISNISTSSLFLSWTPPNGNVGSYRVDVSGSTVMNVTTTSAFANLTGLIPGSMYTLQVVALAVDNMTEGDAVAITGITKPGVVYNLTISNTSTSSLFVSWTPPNGNVGSYRVDVSGSTVMNVTTTSAFANLTGLIPGNMYTLQVVALAVDNMTKGDAVAITGFTKPDVVNNLRISDITASSLSLNWTPPNGNVGSYRVDVPGSTVMNVTTTSAFANLTGLTPGSMYTLQVVALAVDNVTKGDAVAITGFTKPGIVSNLNIGNIDTTSIFLSWSPPSGSAASYRVEVTGVSVTNVTTNSAFATVTGLTPGSMYTLKVLALAGDSVTQGDPVTITTYTKPGTVSNLYVFDIKSTSISLSWSPPSGSVASYKVVVTGATATNVTTTSTFAYITGLTQGSMYTLNVLALAGDSVTQGDAVTITAYTTSVTLRYQLSVLDSEAVNDQIKTLILQKLSSLLQNQLPPNSFSISFKG